MRLAALLLVTLVGCSDDEAALPAPDASDTGATNDATVPDGALPDAPLADATSESEAAIDACGDLPMTAPSVTTCGTSTCLVAGAKSIVLAAGADACTGQVVGARIRDLGDHQLAVAHCAGGSITLAIVDVDAGVVHAQAKAPAGQKNAWVDALRDASGKLHPFLAPSYGDANPVDPTYGAGATWGFGCVFDESRASDTRCGAGFASFTATPADTWFREVGGTSIDLDGDGWDDPTLIFHQRAFAVSGKTGALLSDLVYDVAAATEPSAPKWFHSGRNYGTHSAIAYGDEIRLVEVGGAPVGTFTDYNCNVSRFLAVLSSKKGLPATRKLAWSRYVSFASSIFSVYDEAHASDPAAIVTRLGNFVDGCVHRFSDSRVTIDGKASILYDVFHGKTVNTCIHEQYALYLGDTSDPDPEKRPFGPMKSKVWADCQSANLQAKGTWAMVALAEADGTSVTGGVGQYVWGWSSALTPDGETLYVVEPLPAEHRFDLSDVTPGAMELRALVKGLWVTRATLPRAGRPKIATVDGTGTRGTGAYAGFAELSLRDVDCDGLLDLQLADGSFVGYRAGAFVAK